MRDQGALARKSDPGTSHDAAESVPSAALQAICLKAITAAPGGLTSEEIAAVTGLPLVTVSPRLRPLAEAGFIQEWGKRKNLSGRQAIVWCVAPRTGRLF